MNTNPPLQASAQSLRGYVVREAMKLIMQETSPGPRVYQPHETREIGSHEGLENASIEVWADAFKRSAAALLIEGERRIVFEVSASNSRGAIDCANVVAEELHFCAECITNWTSHLQEKNQNALGLLEFITAKRNSRTAPAA